MRAHARCDCGGGASWCGEAGPEQAGGGAHGKEEAAASLTGGDAGEERWRRGGKTSREGKEAGLGLKSIEDGED